MIKYKLTCKDCDIMFDSWFSTSKEYERLKKKKFLNCYKCHSQKVEKTLMAPQLIKRTKESKNSSELTKYNYIKKTMKNYQKFIKDNFKYVGENFAYEARSIHYNDKKEKNIYGTASKKDLKELREEGIDAQLIPWIEDKNN